MFRGPPATVLSKAEKTTTFSPGAQDGFWMPVNKQLVFRKGKKIISVTFSREKNRNEVDTAQIARMVDARL